MSKISRNAPCPCGSGLKYKMCCLAKIEQDRGIGLAIKWIEENYRDEMREAVSHDYGQGLLGSSTKEDELPEGLFELLQMNLSEWILVDGTAVVDDETVRLLDLVLGDGGPQLEAPQRDYLQLLRGEHLRLYEVVDSKPNEGFWLVDTFAPKPERIWVRERQASQGLRQGDLIGARVIPTEPKTLSGCLYPLPRPQYPRIRRVILDGPKGEDGQPDPSWISRIIIKEWLSTFLGPPPQLVDFSGEPIAPTTVHYRVKNWERAEKAISSQPDVKANADNGWSRIEGDRSLYGIRRTKKDHVELFSLTRQRAEAGEQWLAEIAGDALEKTSSEVADPAKMMKERIRSGEVRDTRRKNEILESLSKEDRTAFFEQFYRKTYARWAEEPIPALKDKTPREAVSTEEGRLDVAELLRTYEVSEARNAEDDDRPPVSFDFLWEQVGLRRTDFAR